MQRATSSAAGRIGHLTQFTRQSSQIATTESSKPKSCRSSSFSDEPRSANLHINFSAALFWWPIEIFCARAAPTEVGENRDEQEGQRSSHFIAEPISSGKMAHETVFRICDRRRARAAAGRRHRRPPGRGQARRCQPRVGRRACGPLTTASGLACAMARCSRASEPVPGLNPMFPAASPGGIALVRGPSAGDTGTSIPYSARVDAPPSSPRQ